MISEKIKAQAIAKIKHRVPAEDIAEEFGLPLKLIKEWYKTLGGDDLVAVEANIHAVETVMKGELVGLNEDTLRETLELTAIDIAKAASLPTNHNDMVGAKAVQLCADAVTKLYQTFIMKGGTGEPTNPNGPGHLSTFQKSMKD